MNENEDLEVVKVPKMKDLEVGDTIEFLMKGEVVAIQPRGTIQKPMICAWVLLPSRRVGINTKTITKVLKSREAPGMNSIEDLMATEEEH